MRKLLTLSAPLALMASPALAAEPDVTGTVEITGKVTGRCMFTLDNAKIDLGDIAKTADGKLDTAKVNSGSAKLSGWCNNTAATMSVQATELTTGTDEPTGFDNRVDFIATATAGTITAADGTKPTDPITEPGDLGLFSGDITVTLSNASSPDNELMVAGSYSGTVVVTLAPNIETPS